MNQLITYVRQYLTPNSDKISGEISPDVSGDFDYYVLQLSYAPEFCILHPDQAGSPECQSNLALVLHGLWPQWHKSRKPEGLCYPEFCSTQYQQVDIMDILSRIADWQSVAPEYQQLALHEWQRHGSCSGLNPQSYFQLAIDLARSLITLIGNRQDYDWSTAGREQLQKVFPQGKLQYDANGNLGTIDFYFDKQGRIMPLTEIL